MSEDGKEAGFKKGPLLVDYVAIFGPGDESFESKQSKELLADPTCRLEGTVIAQVPETDHPHQPFPPGVSMFVFPTGILMKPTKSKRSFHSFVLTMASGTRMYGYCCTLYMPLDAKKMAIVRMQIAAKLMSLDNPNLDNYQLPSQLYVPKSICVLSTYPFLQKTMKLLKQLCARYIHSEEDISATLATTFYQLLKTPGPVQGQSPVYLTISRSLTEFSLPSLSEPPLADVDFDILLTRLDPMNLVTLLNCVLLELPVLVISCHAEILTPALEALVALMYPFTWNYIYIPLLPSCLNDVFSAPQAYLIGTLTETLNDPPWPSNSVIVDLDNNDVSVNVHGTHAFVPLPWRYQWRLYASLTKRYNIYYERHPQARLNYPKDLPPFCRVLDTPQESQAENFFGASQLPIITLDTANVLASGLDESSDDNWDEDQGSGKSRNQAGEGEESPPPSIDTLSNRTISDDTDDRRLRYRTRGSKPLPPSFPRPLSSVIPQPTHPDGNLLVEEDGDIHSPVKQRKGQIEEVETEKKTIHRTDVISSGTIKLTKKDIPVDSRPERDKESPGATGRDLRPQGDLGERLRSLSADSTNVSVRSNFLAEAIKTSLTTNVNTKKDMPIHREEALKQAGERNILGNKNLEKYQNKDKDTEPNLGLSAVHSGKKVESNLSVSSSPSLSSSLISFSSPSSSSSSSSSSAFASLSPKTGVDPLPCLSRSSSRDSEDSFIEVSMDTPQDNELLRDDQSARKGRSKKLRRRAKDGSGGSAEPEVFELEGVDGVHESHPSSAPAVMTIERERELDESDRDARFDVRDDGDRVADEELEKILNQGKQQRSAPRKESLPISIPSIPDRSTLRDPRRSEEKKKSKDLMAIRKSFLSVFVSLFKNYDQWIRAKDLSSFHRSPPPYSTRSGSSYSADPFASPPKALSRGKGDLDQELKNVAADVTPLKSGLEESKEREREAIRDLSDDSPSEYPPSSSSTSTSTLTTSSSLSLESKKSSAKEEESSAPTDRFFLYRDRVDSTFTRTEFDERGFQSQFESKADKLFIQRIIESQMFNVFIQQRMTRLYVGASPDWFDLSVTKTIQRRQGHRYKKGRQFKCGILFKQGSVIPSWHPRFFVLEGLTLTYYKPTYGEQIAMKARKLRRLLTYEKNGRCPPSKISNLKRQIDIERTNLDKLKLSLAKGVTELVVGQTKVGIPDTPGRLYKTGFVFEVIVPSHRLIACSETSQERDSWIEFILARTLKPSSPSGDSMYLYRRPESELLASALQYLGRKSQSDLSSTGGTSRGSNLSSPVESQNDLLLDYSGRTPPSSSPRKSMSMSRLKRTPGFSPTTSSPTKVRPEHIRGRFGTVI